MSGISLANQEDTARATQEASDADTVFQQDYAAMVEAMRRRYLGCGRLLGSEFGAFVFVESVANDMRQAWMNRDTSDNDCSFFASQWGFPALLRVIARAIELETKK